MKSNLELVVISFYFTFVKADIRLEEKLNIDYNWTNQFFDNVSSSTSSSSNLKADNRLEEEFIIDYNLTDQFFGNMSLSSTSNLDRPIQNESIITIGKFLY